MNRPGPRLLEHFIGRCGALGFGYVVGWVGADNDEYEVRIKQGRMLMSCNRHADPNWAVEQALGYLNRAESDRAAKTAVLSRSGGEA